MGGAAEGGGVALFFRMFLTRFYQVTSLTAILYFSFQIVLRTHNLNFFFVLRKKLIKYYFSKIYFLLLLEQCLFGFKYCYLPLLYYEI